MAPKRADLPFWLSVAVGVSLTLMALLRRGGRWATAPRLGENGPPFGEPRSSEEPRELERRRAHERDRGRHATHPLQIPRKGWYDILWRTYHEMQSDRLLSIAGGVAFFVLLAIFPAITALVSAYGLYFNASTIANNLSLLDGVVPGSVIAIVHEQASRIAANSGRALSIGIVAGIMVSLWSATSGVKAMIDALNVIYEQKEGRNFIRLNLLALVFTLAGFAAFLLAIAVIVVLPLILSPIGLGSLAETLMRIARWPVLLVALLIGLAVLYRYGPDRRKARWQWVSVGSLFAAVTWIVASFLFSWYLTSFANYNATYGSLGAVVGLMIWLWISTIVVLLGAELNAEIEHQTARDSTIGAERPLGTRGAVMADTVGAKQT
ncbi:MAG TPA: YihY/virulence factor BrkB family protein [Xanthobacteraceae bacterium]|jgi:membrane protein